MYCFFHPSKPAVAQCVDCHKALCLECASKYTIPICDACNNRRKFAERIGYLKPLIICIILYFIGYNLKIFNPDDTLGGYMCMSIYAGWKVINQFIPNLFVWFNLKAIFWYYLIRISVSMFIGVIVTPIYLLYCTVMLVRSFFK